MLLLYYLFVMSLIFNECDGMQIGWRQECPKRILKLIRLFFLRKRLLKDVVRKSESVHSFWRKVYNFAEEIYVAKINRFIEFSNIFYFFNWINCTLPTKTGFGIHRYSIICLLIYKSLNLQLLQTDRSSPPTTPGRKHFLNQLTNQLITKKGKKTGWFSYPF